MARIRVKDLCLRTYIGINEDEILNKQDVLINLTILYAAQEAVRDNDIDHALNYRTITKAIIAHVEGNRFALLERLTQELLDLVMSNESVLYAEVEVDKETGKVTLLDFVAVVDCGTVINPALARVQTEGGIVQGIGMALFEDVQYDKKGNLQSNSFMTYKIPGRGDVGTIRVAFEESYEPTGPFGAKSVGEVVINTPSPAIVAAIYNAVGVQITDLPVTPEKVFNGMQQKQKI